MIHNSTGKGCSGMTGGTVLGPNRGMDLIGRGVRRRNTTRDMTALARRRTDGAVIHYHTRPARISMTGLTAV